MRAFALSKNVLKMHKFVRNLLSEWRKLGLPFGGETFIVAVSGGADSVGLMLALDDLRKRKKLNLHFIVAHFDHGLRGAESENDAGFVEELAEKFGFEYVLGKGKISKQGNLEQNARLARYGFLIETARSLQAQGILTAHTINDQAETFLLNLIRGSGVAGLSAMKPLTANYESRITNYESKSEIPNPKTQIGLVRPFLNWATREATEDFCRANRVEFRHDAMNDDLRFRRVKIRKILLPVLKEFNPKIVETLARTANLLKNEIEPATAIEEPRINSENRCLILKELKILPKSTFYKSLRDWLKWNRGSLRQIDLNHVEALERLIFSPKSGRTVELPAGDTVVKKGGKLLFCRKNIENNG